MTQEPSPKQTLLLWVLLFTGEEPAISLAKPELTKAERDQMATAGLVRLEKRGRKTHYVLADKAWDWAAGHLDAAFSIRSPATAPALAGLLRRLKAYLEIRELALVDVLRPRPAKPVPIPRPAADPAAPAHVKGAGAAAGPVLEEAVVRAYLQASGSAWNVWVRLAEIRRRLPDVPRQDLDRELLRLERTKRGVLYRIDDPQDIRPEDAAGALDVAGFKRHIFLMRG
jgi:hypothetical protein